MFLAKSGNEVNGTGGIERKLTPKTYAEKLQSGEQPPASDVDAMTREYVAG